jgi:glucose-fructose oxidoreductase
VRYAVVGLGWIAQESILPAFAKARANSELQALVSDDPGKLRVLGRKYGVTKLFSYDDYERCLRDVDAVFIALPNSLHREFTERAARARVHVLCEKPMAVTEQDARAMLRACDRAGVKLMIAYRLHFERATLTALDAIRKGRVGDPRFFQSSFAMKAEPGNLRLRPGEGGALYDIGVYCLNAARNLFGSEPVEAFGEHVRGKGARFRHVPETTAAVLRFPGERIASFTSSFGAEGKSTYEVFGTKGTLRMAPAYSHSDRLTLQVTRNGATKTKNFPVRDQFAAEIIHFSDAILNDQKPGPSGEEGLRDVRVLAAIERSAQRRRPVKLARLGPVRRPRKEQEIHRPAGGPHRLVKADDPRPD